MNAFYSNVATAGETCQTSIDGDGISVSTYASKTNDLNVAATSLQLTIGTVEQTITNGGNRVGVHSYGAYSNAVPACLYLWDNTYNNYPIITEVVPTDRSVTGQQLRDYLFRHDESQQNFLGSL